MKATSETMSIVVFNEKMADLRSRIAQFTYEVQFLGLKIQVGRLKGDVRILKRELIGDWATRPAINCKLIPLHLPEGVSEDGETFSTNSSPGGSLGSGIGGYR